MTNRANAKYFESLERTGITRHPGGLGATRRLVQRVGIVPGQRILDIGCGTGYTACSLAKKHRVEVVAVDLRPRILEWAKRRVDQEGVGERVTLLEADVHDLPFPANDFDVVLTESVLVFCDVKRAASEMHRVLKPWGRFGSSEATVSKPLPARSREAFVESSMMDISLLDEREWQEVFRDAGCVDVSSVVRPVNLLDSSLLTPLRTHGVRRLVSSIFRGVTDPALLTIVASKSSRQVARLMLRSYLEDGLHTGTKAEKQPGR